MKKADILEFIQTKLGEEGHIHSLAEINRVLTALPEALRHALSHTEAKHAKLELPGIGVFKLKESPARPARVGRNPRTGAAVEIPATEKSYGLGFKASKSLAEQVNAVQTQHDKAIL